MFVIDQARLCGLTAAQFELFRLLCQRNRNIYDESFQTICNEAYAIARRCQNVEAEMQLFFPRYRAQPHYSYAIQAEKAEQL